MPDYRRPLAPGGTVFFTVTLQDRGSRRLVEEIGRLREAVRATRAERPFGVAAWVVLPDHLHCVWTLPEGGEERPENGPVDRFQRRTGGAPDSATRWRLIKTRFSRGLPPGRLRPSHVARAERGIWQRRFHEQHIRSDEELAAAVEYCRTNPVRHGFVERPEEWPFSSFHARRP